MAAIADSILCPSCGKRHTLCLPTSDFIDGDTVYRYECPTTLAIVPYQAWNRYAAHRTRLPDRFDYHVLKTCVS